LKNKYKLPFRIVYGGYMKVFECSTIDIAPTISRLLKIPMVPPSGRPISEVEKYAKVRTCKRAVIIVVDSLGYSFFIRLSTVMKNLNELAEKGLLFKCRSCATITSPAIASIFTGYRPEEHNIYSTADIYTESAKDSENPRLRSIMEWACRAGMKASAVIESEGAESFRGRIKDFYGVPDSEDILDYDRQITEYAIDALMNKPDILAVHLRSIDRFSHRAKSWEELRKAAEAVDENLGKIFKSAEKGTIFFVCGDHTIHGGEKWLKRATAEEARNHRQNLVALVVGCN
jgi:predicted AlkP superfamily pyrophosphatase or phosphodiesterase